MELFANKKEKTTHYNRNIIGPDETNELFVSLKHGCIYLI